MITSTEGEERNTIDVTQRLLRKSKKRDGAVRRNCEGKSFTLDSRQNTREGQRRLKVYDPRKRREDRGRVEEG